MITLAEILEMQTASKDANLCLVRVPLLEPAGNKTKVTMWATMILPPGIHGGYEVGDVVFISFADNSLSRPVVLGQLYRGPLHASTGSMIDNIGKASDTFDQASEFSCRKFKATESAQIPVATKLEYPENTAVLYRTIADLAKEVSDLKTEVEKLKTSSDITNILRVIVNNPLDHAVELKKLYPELVE